MSAEIEQHLSKLRLDEASRAALAREFKRYCANSESEQADLAQGTRLAIAQCGERLACLTDAYVDRLIEKDLFEDRKAKLLKERIDLEDQLAELTSGSRTIEMRLQNFLELLEAIATKPESLPGTELRDLAVSVTSNLGADGKYIVFDWKSPFHVVAEPSPFLFSPPDRCTPRTSASQHKEAKDEMREDVPVAQEPLDMAALARRVIDTVLQVSIMTRESKRKRT